MDGPVFDAMLKNALEEALRQDVEEAPAPSPPAWQQRRRMRRLLADPRAVRGGFPETEAARRFRNPARYLAVVVIAALLTGAAAAGLVLGGGERFRQMFERDGWAADYYGNAVDTTQLLDMGAEMDTAFLESGGLRFEMLDAVFDGQLAMVELRLTILDPAVLECLQEENPAFREAEILLENGGQVEFWGYSSSSREEGGDPEGALEKGQYSLVFTIHDEDLNTGGRCSIRLRDLTLFGAEGEQTPLLAGEWTLSITLRPTEVLRLEPNAVCRVNGVDWILDGVTLSPLALGLTFHREEGGRYSRWAPYKGLAIRLKSGEVLDIKGSTGIGSSDTHIDVHVEFLMPLDLERADSLLVCGVEIPLREPGNP